MLVGGYTTRDWSDLGSAVPGTCSVSAEIRICLWSTDLAWDNTVQELVCEKIHCFFLGMLDVQLCNTNFFSSKSFTFNKLYWSIFLPWQYWQKMGEWFLALDSYCFVNKMAVFLTCPLGKLVCHPDMSAVLVEQWVFFYNWQFSLSPHFPSNSAHATETRQTVFQLE